MRKSLVTADEHGATVSSIDPKTFCMTWKAHHDDETCMRLTALMNGLGPKDTLRTLADHVIAEGLPIPHIRFIPEATKDA